MKNIIKLFMLYLVGVVFVGCEKDNISNAFFEDNPERLNEVASDLRSKLASAENGWVMMVKTDLNSEVFTPVIMKFDTLKNLVHVKTVYGETADTESFFRISNGTGSPQLIFTTGSIMSSLYRIGIRGSDITDHIYNLVSASADTIAIRGYRSGGVYKPEGGVIFKMFKRPQEWKWADDTKYFDMTSAAFRVNVESVASTFKFEYVNNPNKNKTINSVFTTVPAANVQNMRNGFIFALSRNIGAGGFKPTDYVNMRFPYLATTMDAAPVVANNAMSFLPQVSGYTSNVGNMNNFINTFNFHYLVCTNVTRTGSNVKMDFEAYDRKGNPIVKAFYDNLK